MKFKALYKLDFWLILAFIFMMSGGSPFFKETSQTLQLFLVLGGIFLFRNHKFGKIYLSLALLWASINFVSANFINPQQPFSAITPFSRFIQLTVIYFIIRLSGINFFDKLSKYLFVMTIISISLFAIQLIAPSAMNVLVGPLSFMTRDYYTKAGSWYGFVYMFNTWHIDRNCGFMWEPGAFAGILVLMITYQLSNNKFVLDKYIYVYLIALISSISTTGYLSLALILLAFFIKKGKKYKYLLFLLPVFIFFAVGFYNKSDFLSGKINIYMESGTDIWAKENDAGIARVSRLGMALIILDESLHWPFGHGVINHSKFKLEKYGKIIGPGSLSAVLHQWGWIGLIGIFWYIYKFFRIKADPLSSKLFTASMGIILFSNPGSFLFIIFAIVFYVIIYGKRKELKPRTSTSINKYSKKHIVESPV